MLKKIKDVILYKDYRFYSAFPAITKLSNNELLLAFRKARDVRHLLDESYGDNDEIQLLKTQMDHIDSRSQIVTIHLDMSLNQTTGVQSIFADPEAADQDCSLLTLKNGNVLLSSFSWYPVPARLAPMLKKQGVNIVGNSVSSGCHYIMWGSFTSLSKDNGHTWSQHNYLPKLPLADDIIPNKRDSSGGAAHGQAIELNGEVLLSVYSKISTYSTCTCHLYVSRDNGETWAYRSTIAVDTKQKIHFEEPALLHCNNNKIIAFMRTSNAGDHLYTSVSEDQGKSWSEPLCRKEIIGHPTHPIKLADGRIFICYGYRHKPFGIRGRLMDKDAKGFISEEFIIRDDGFCTDIGYPCAVQLENSDIFVVYYFTNEDGIRHIAGSRLSLG